jgi:hypothetical protein
MWVGIGFGGLLPSEELGFFCIWLRKHYFFIVNNMQNMEFFISTI